MKSINIIMPAYNEAKRLPETLSAYHKYFFPENTKAGLQKKYDLKIVLINDGSEDETLEVAEELFKKYKIKHEILDYGKNHGKGYAVRFGMLNSSSADFYYLCDADLSAPWDVLGKLMNELDSTGSDAAIGSRAIEGAEVDTAAERYVSGRASNFIINAILGLGFKDTQCGYKLFSSKCLRAFQLQKIDRWGFDFEILYILKLLGMNTVEVPIRWQNREGSKVKPIDYVKTMQQLLKVKMTKYKI